MVKKLSAILLTTAAKFALASSNAAHGENLFSYDPAAVNGPSKWSSLDLGETANACNGSKQSGIDIPTSSCNETNADYKFESGTCSVDDLSFSISDHSIQVNYNASICSPPRMSIPHIASTYVVLQLHFHTGSEHALDGKHFGGEIHIVHQELGGQGLAVLGLFVDPTSFDETNYFDALIPGWEAVANATLLECAKTDVAVTQGLHRRSLTQKDRDSRSFAESFNPYGLVPEGSTYFFYSGSLTTPPCTEIVSWNVVDKPVSLSVHEYMKLADLILQFTSPETCSLATVASPTGETSRPTQPINGRPIIRKCPTGTELQFEGLEEHSSSSISKVETLWLMLFLVSSLIWQK